MPLDRAGRDRLAESIRHLASGATTNWEFEDAAEFRSPDPAIGEIFWRGAWFLYSDVPQYRRRGRHRLSPDERCAAARWVLFLKTDLPYEWPVVRRAFIHQVMWVLRNLVTLGSLGRQAQRDFATHGDVTVWPFIRRPDFDAALANPRYLSGGFRPRATS